MAKQLTEEAINILKSDPQLYGDVSDVLDVSPLYMPKLIRENNRRLTEAAAAELIAAKLNKSISEIIEEAPEPVK